MHDDRKEYDGDCQIGSGLHICRYDKGGECRTVV